MPYIDGCAVCGSLKELEYFELSQGGILCKNCKSHSMEENLIKINPTVVKLLNFICKSDYKSVFTFNAKETDLNIVSVIAEKYMINCLEMYPSALSYLKSIIIGWKIM